MTIPAIRYSFIAITAMLLFLNSSAQAQWPTDLQYGKTYLEVGANVYDRPGTDLGLGLITDSVTNGIVLDSDTLTDLNAGGGAQIKFGSVGRFGRQFEIRSTLNTWEEQHSFEGDNLTSPLSPGLDPDQVDIEYDSEYFSVDFSVKRVIFPGFTFLFGPRLAVLNEDLSFDTTTDLNVGGFPTTVESENDINTRNTMLGFQVGGDFNAPLTRDMFVQGFIRAAGMANFSRVNTFADTNFSTATEAEFTKDAGAFIGEVGGRIYTDLVPNCVTSYIGYEATWLDGVAISPSQFDIANTNNVMNGQTPFFHAVTFGVRLSR